MSVYFCGGSCIEDVTTHLMYHLSLHPTLRTCSADTILRAIKKLTQDNISYTSDTGKTYDLSLNVGFDYIYLYRDRAMTEWGVTVVTVLQLLKMTLQFPLYSI